MRKKIVVVLAILIAVGIFYMGYKILNTKSHSPFEITKYDDNGVYIKVEYCRPYKKDRIIFGGLVPFDQVWRTGANEATIIKTNKALKIQGQTLQAGNYSLWTVPNDVEWKIIFNKEVGQWGVKFGGKPNIDMSKNSLEAMVKPQTVKQTVEQFTIQFNKAENSNDMLLELIWDKTKITLPFEVLK